MQTLEQILARLSEASQDELASALSTVQTETARLAEAPVTEETVTQLEALAAARTQIEAETTKRSELAARHANALGQLAADTDDNEADGKDEDGAEGDESADGEDGNDEGGESEDGADEGQEQAVVAAARRPLGKITKTKAAKAPATAALPVVTVSTFAHEAVATPSGVINSGQAFTRETLAEALSTKAHAVQEARGSGKHYVLREKAIFPEERHLKTEANYFTNRSKIEAVQKAARAPEALVAAGGLCGPLEVRYDIDVLGETARPVRDGLARFGVDRGGITYRAALDGASLDATGFWTVADDVADPLVPKTCLVLDCPATVDAEIYAVYHCVELPNMTARFDPEWADATVRATRVGHDRQAENQLLTALRAGSKLLTSPKVLGAARDILSNLDRSIAYLRNRRRLTDMTPLRAIFPRWVLDMLRADMVNQMATANADYLAMADSQLTEWFTRRNVAVTWHLDGLGSVAGPPVISQQFYSNAAAGSVIPEFPDVIEGFLFTEGEWLFLDGGTLDMGVVRDSTLNSRNRYQMFSESFEGIAFTGVESLRLAMTVDPTGLSAGTVATGGTE